MKNRKMLGRNGDLAEIIAATKPDPYATKRIYAACDWEHDEKIWEITKNVVRNAMKSGETGP